MEFREVTKNAFVLVGYSAAGKWGAEMDYPIPDLWGKAERFIKDEKADKIVGVCLPPRSDDYYYTCGLEFAEVDYHKVESGMTLHTFPAHKYVVFKHTGPSAEIPSTYGKLWETFDREGYKIMKGMPEIEVVEAGMFGKEDLAEYEMEIWVPVES
ncbi:GyrI-like domain-containing protein [Heyndrickxia sp. MSNUG]|uniref:GyrI-like domain-containing protein n=1 Tax=Heyndrickxia sp. MSNUG TaxID=3136677 RepID=UPI003C2D9565